MVFARISMFLTPIKQSLIEEFFRAIGDNLPLKGYLQGLFYPIVEFTARSMNLKVCSLMLIDAKKEELWTCATQSTSSNYVNKPNIKIWEGISGRAIREQRMIEVTDVRTADGYRFPQVARKESLASLISVPIKIGKYVIGVINGYTAKPHQFAEDELSMFNTISNIVSLVFEGTVLREENMSLQYKLKRADIVEHAKSVLIEKRGFSENEAHQFLRKQSMENHVPLADVAKEVIASGR